MIVPCEAAATGDSSCSYVLPHPPREWPQDVVKYGKQLGDLQAGDPSLPRDDILRTMHVEWWLTTGAGTLAGAARLLAVA